MIDGKRLPSFGDPELEYTEEERERMKKGWDACKPTLKGIKGTVTIFGTGGKDTSDLNELERMFFDPENYNTKK